MRMFITSKNKYLSNDTKIFGTCSIPLIPIHNNKLLDILENNYFVIYDLLHFGISSISLIY